MNVAYTHSKDTKQSLPEPATDAEGSALAPNRPTPFDLLYNDICNVI